jgi:plastocyanin
MAVCVRASAVKPTVAAKSAGKRAPVVQKIAQAAALGVSTFALALSAHADATVKLGADSGALVFEPATVTIKSGESVTWTNNAGYPHNIVFDEDNVPVGGARIWVAGPCARRDWAQEA